MKILYMNEKIREEVFKAEQILKKGGVILYPTDTIWGLGCDATNYDAVKRIYEIKKRVDSKSMLILVDDLCKVSLYCEMPELAIDLVECSDQPLTIIYPNAKGVADNLIAEDRTIGIRVTNEEFSKSLIYKFRRALVSTSANFSGKSSPRFFDEIDNDIKKMVDHIVNYRQEDRTVNSPSSIIKLGVNGVIEIIRK